MCLGYTNVSFGPHYNLGFSVCVCMCAAATAGCSGGSGACAAGGGVSCNLRQRCGGSARPFGQANSSYCFPPLKTYMCPSVNVVFGFAQSYSISKLRESQSINFWDGDSTSTRKDWT